MSLRKDVRAWFWLCISCTHVQNSMVASHHLESERCQLGWPEQGGFACRLSHDLALPTPGTLLLLLSLGKHGSTTRLRACPGSQNTLHPEPWTTLEVAVHPSPCCSCYPPDRLGRQAPAPEVECTAAASDTYAEGYVPACVFWVKGLHLVNESRICSFYYIEV